MSDSLIVLAIDEETSHIIDLYRNSVFNSLQWFRKEIESGWNMLSLLRNEMHHQLRLNNELVLFLNLLLIVFMKYLVLVTINSILFSQISSIDIWILKERWFIKWHNEDKTTLSNESLLEKIGLIYWYTSYNNVKLRNEVYNDRQYFFDTMVLSRYWDINLLCEFNI